MFYRTLFIVKEVENVQHPCKVLARQIEFEKQKMTVLRELIAELSDLAAGRRSSLLAGQALRLSGYSILIATGLLGKIGAVLTKIAAGTAGVGLTRDIAELAGDSDLQSVNGIIDDAVREFRSSNRKMQQLRREYKELQCDVKFGKAP